jgi:PBP1b-binding outer membrane lipoprotein LpoB
MNKKITKNATLLLLCAIFISGCMQVIDAPTKKTMRTNPSLANSTNQGPSQEILIERAALSISNQLISQLRDKSSSKVIGIAPIINVSTEAGQLMTTINQRIKSNLFITNRFEIVADLDMSRALSQLKSNEELWYAGALSDESKLRMKRLTGADSLVHGKVSVENSYFHVSYQMINLETGLLESIADETIPKQGFSGSSNQRNINEHLGTLAYNSDWLETKLDALVIENGQICAVFTFINTLNKSVILSLKDPTKNIYATDEKGNSYNYVGANGLDAKNKLEIRPGVRKTVKIYFEKLNNSSNLLTVRTAWEAKGTATRFKSFNIEDVPVSEINSRR